MTTFEIWSLWLSAASVIVAAGVGIGQIWVVVRGIKMMSRSSAVRNEEHERRHKEVMDQNSKQHAEAMKKHEENMKKHEENMRRHDEATAESARRHDEAMAESARRHEEAMASLQALIERTAPAP